MVLVVVRVQRVGGYDRRERLVGVGAVRAIGTWMVQSAGEGGAVRPRGGQSQPLRRSSALPSARPRARRPGA
jgi:hypothetical protein